MSIYVTLSNISFSYPSSSFSLFEDLSLSFHEGWTTILGSNGCGKSTLASLIEGSLTPEAGAIEKRGNAVLCSQIFSGIKDEDYALWYRDVTEEPQKYQGKTVRFRGQVAMLRRERNNMFAPGRFVMTCCVEDIQFCGVPCRYAGSGSL